MNKAHMVYYISLCLVLPISMLCFYLERRARRIIVSMICGVLVGVLAFWINTFIKNTFGIDDKYLTMFVAPVVEELLKFIPVIAVHFIVKKGRRGSAANAYSVGLGFCVSENFFYLITSLDTANALWLIMRCIGTGVMHSMTTTVMGIGIYSARTSEKYKVLRIVASVLVAMAFHITFNSLLQTPLKAVAVVLPIIVFIVLFVVLKKENLHKFLWDESDSKKKAQEE